jgi:uncharacterized membrane protein
VNNWKVIPTIVFATVLIFGAGVFTGGILVDYVKQAHPHPGIVRAKPPAQASTNAPSVSTNGPNALATRPPPQVLSKEFLQRLDGDLHLTKDQHEAVQKIISDGQNEMRKVMQDSRLEIREVLTADQRDQFDVLMKRPFHKPIFTNAPPVAVPGAPLAAPTNAP